MLDNCSITGIDAHAHVFSRTLTGPQSQRRHPQTPAKHAQVPPPIPQDTTKQHQAAVRDDITNRHPADVGCSQGKGLGHGRKGHVDRTVERRDRGTTADDGKAQPRCAGAGRVREGGRRRRHGGSAWLQAPWGAWPRSRLKPCPAQAGQGGSTQDHLLTVA